MKCSLVMDKLSVLRAHYIQNLQNYFMKIDIPIPCPRCGGKMYSVGYDSTLKLLKNRTWQVCKECHFERTTDEFKKSICCA